MTVVDIPMRLVENMLAVWMVMHEDNMTTWIYLIDNDAEVATLPVAKLCEAMHSRPNVVLKRVGAPTWMPQWKDIEYKPKHALNMHLGDSLALVWMWLHLGAA